MRSPDDSRMVFGEGVAGMGEELGGVPPSLRLWDECFWVSKIEEIGEESGSELALVNWDSGPAGASWLIEPLLKTEYMG